MQRDLVLTAVGMLASGFFSWLFTHLYYKRALALQAGAAQAELSKLTELVEQGKTSAAVQRQLLWQKRLEDCVHEHQRSGTSVGLIDTFDDLGTDEKADLLDAVSMRMKGRKPKLNKYRQAT